MQKTAEQHDAPQEHPVSSLKKPTIEQRFEPKLKHAEWLLVLVLAFMLWTAGFVDLATHRSQNATVFGVYSIPYAMMLFIYLGGFWAWGRLIFPSDSIDVLRRGVAAIQQRAWLGIALFIAAFGLLGTMLVWDRWANYPLLQGSFLIILFLAGLVLLFARPFGVQQIQPWRKVLIGLFGVWFGIEVLLQFGSLAAVLPLNSYTGLFTPFGRVYQQREGSANSRTNRYGMYYPDLKLLEGTRRIVVTGDSYILGAQVKPEQNIGIVLQDLLNTSNSEPQVEVASIGVPGYGPGVYAEPRMLPYSIAPLGPQEVIVYFHTADDLQTVTGPDQGVPFYQLQSDGSVNAHPDSQELRHIIWHEVIRGYEPVRPLHTVLSHFFTIQFLDNLLGNRFSIQTTPHIFPRNTEFVQTQQAFGRSSFAFSVQSDRQADDSLAIAQAQLLAFNKALNEQGMTLRIVTIPYFPEAFFTSNGDWKNAVQGYDIVRPEQVLKKFAIEQQIPFLAMGEYMQSKQMSSQDIQSLFFQNGAGHFTAAGHTLFAKATYQCFYAAELQSNAACASGKP